MDIGTVVGMAGAFTLMIVAIFISPGGSLGAFIDIPSVAVVIGGSILTMMVSLPVSIVLLLPKVVMKSVFATSVDLKGLVTKLVEFAMVARRDGILALENHVDESTDPFIATGIRLAVDGTDAGLIEKLLNEEIEALADRHKKGKQLCDLMGKYAPAFGMIGTLIGLVLMLGNMSDPSAIGPGMAVALLTTLYGAVVANVVFLPISDKLSYYSKEEVQARILILRGVMAIQAGDNPRIVEQKLNVFLAPKDRAAPS